MAASVSNVSATPPAASRDLFAMMKTAVEVRNAPFMNGKANPSPAATAAAKDPTTPTAASPEQFVTMMAAALVNGVPFVNYEPNINRAAMVAAETPVVRLPERKACLLCPHYARRHGAVLVQPEPYLFDDLIEKAGEGFDPLVAAAGPPPRTLAGVDFSYGPHDPVTPGFDDLARVEDPTVLADALFFNHVLPECACTEALFDAADHEGWAGVQLDFLRQEAALKARRKPRAPVA